MVDSGEKEPDAVLADFFNEAAKRFFGYSYLFPYQRLVAANILEAARHRGIPVQTPGGAERGEQPFFQDDARASDSGCLGRQIVILPTGSGKSLCFQLPAVFMEGITLVIYPILSLMADQERRLRERGFDPVTLRGGQCGEEREALWKKLRSGKSKFIIANPEVLLTPPVMNRLGSLGIAHVVVDEAHCVGEWGESFRPSYLEIGRIIEASGAPLITAFTATAGAPVLEKIERYIFGGGAHLISGSPNRPNITYSALGCVLRDLAVRDLLLTNSRPAIVFCSSRPGAERLAHYLREKLREEGAAWYGEVRYYHAGLDKSERAEVERWFLRNREAVLAATCAFGMGIDKADIRTVIHRDCPPSVEAYLQETGRAGRDGLPSKAILLWGPDDQMSLRRAGSEQEKARLTGLLNYARDISRCRRKTLLELLRYDDSDAISADTSCCDVCEKRVSAALREESGIVDFFRRNRRRYTISEAASILAGGDINWAEEEARAAIGCLLKIGKLKTLKSFFWKGKITVSGEPLTPQQFRISLC
ncbi:MAG: RecQ family ATP-dependent DNA helicase [Treponema sp.]|jgi:ATP-dependent DNA helicase RecQ|nr:RecQ family ATP-dependent DNA helicase [Treponema sp.]